jgi:release factor glutamine methyltransferase
MTQIADALRAAVSPALSRLEAQLLMLHTLGHAASDRAWLLAHDSDLIDPPRLAQFNANCERRAQGEPLAYITGQKAFFGLDLQVDARVLDPRADTETLVEWGLGLLKELKGPAVLDLGTGSGAVALALAHNRPDATVSASDASQDALDVAQANGARLGLALRWHLGSWFDALPPQPPTRTPLQPGGYALIVSNPPYIAATDAHLAALCHEPLSALVSGVDGLDALREIVRNAPGHLQPGGWLLLEHGFDQADAVGQLLRSRGFVRVQSRNDLAGIARCTGGQWAK